MSVSSKSPLETRPFKESNYIPAFRFPFFPIESVCLETHYGKYHGRRCCLSGDIFSSPPPPIPPSESFVLSPPSPILLLEYCIQSVVRLLLLLSRSLFLPCCLPSFLHFLHLPNISLDASIDLPFLYNSLVRIFVSFNSIMFSSSFFSSFIYLSFHLYINYFCHFLVLFLRLLVLSSIN